MNPRTRARVPSSTALHQFPKSKMSGAADAIFVISFVRRGLLSSAKTLKSKFGNPPTQFESTSATGPTNAGTCRSGASMDMTCSLRLSSPFPKMGMHRLSIGVISLIFWSAATTFQSSAADECEAIADPHAYNYCLAAKGPVYKPRSSSSSELPDNGPP